MQSLALANIFVSVKQLNEIELQCSGIIAETPMLYPFITHFF